jgi:L-rhamnose isomerase
MLLGLDVKLDSRSIDEYRLYRVAIELVERAYRRTVTGASIRAFDFAQSLLSTIGRGSRQV